MGDIGGEISSATSEIADEVTNSVSNEPYSSETVSEEAKVLNFIFPVDGKISKNYSETELQYSATYGDMRLHTGIDIACEKGASVKAMEEGRVVSVEENTSFGTVITVDHGNGITAKYCGIENVTVKAEDKFVTVTTSPAGFVGWKDENGVFVSTSATTKWYPQTATSALTPVYEGTVEAGATANAVSKDGKLTVTVTPTFVSMGVNEYGYYISVGTAIDTEALDGVTKVTANNAFAAYLQRVYDLKPATKGQTIYVVAYIVVDGVTTYGSTSVVA
jgi:hypothetical protein